MPLVSETIKTLFAYVPGKPIEETERELGITGVAKLASNENALGPSPMAVRAVQEAMLRGHLYPDGSCFYLKGALAERLGVRPEELVIGNGSNEILVLLVRTFLRPAAQWSSTLVTPESALGQANSGEPGDPSEAHIGQGDDEAIVSEGSFIVYRLALQAHGVRTVRVPLKDRGFDLKAMAAAVTPQTRMVFLANPNNPTGTYVSKKALQRFLKELPRDLIVVLDEAYFEYVSAEDYPDGLELRQLHPRLCVLRTFSKIHGLASLRVGYGVLPPEMADYLNRVRDPFNVNALAQAGALAALSDEAHAEQSARQNASERARLEQRLVEMGVHVTPSVANFLLCDFKLEAQQVYERLMKEGLIVRPMAGYGFPRSARITIGLPAENDRLCEALPRILS